MAAMFLLIFKCHEIRDGLASLFNGIATLNWIFTTEIWFICKCNLHGIYNLPLKKKKLLSPIFSLHIVIW